LKKATVVAETSLVYLNISVALGLIVNSYVLFQPMSLFKNLLFIIIYYMYMNVPKIHRHREEKKRKSQQK